MKDQKIIVMNDLLQDAVNYFITDIKENFDIDLENKILNDEEYEQVQERSLEAIFEYEVYNQKLFELFWPLYAEGYNPLEKVQELENTEPTIVLDSLREFVIDTIFEHQEELKINSQKIKR
ncbi:hypothetical protein [Spiroplasma sp. AdecLV25b]|uniref:hypothetical protein n=1 Tax=Spiroplasma sp. AdecLV25b TaxID=3027162 RepID=UPI0027E028FC|nr:hypothetical protein [Spiroplasma sp. AdecLV25b]